VKNKGKKEKKIDMVNAQLLEEIHKVVDKKQWKAARMALLDQVMI